MISVVAEEKPVDSSHGSKRSNTGGGYYTIRVDHDTERSEKRTMYTCDKHDSETHTEFGEVAVSDVGHSEIMASDTAENNGTKTSTSDILVVRYTLDASETLHCLLSTDSGELGEKKHIHRPLLRIRSVGDATGDHLPDRETKIGDRSHPRDTVTHLTAKNNIPNGTLSLDTVATDENNDRKATRRPEHEDPKRRSLQSRWSPHVGRARLL